MIQKQTFKWEVIKANMNMFFYVYELVHITIKNIYKKYYSDEAVKFFLELHSKENISHWTKTILNGYSYCRSFKDKELAL